MLFIHMQSFSLYGDKPSLQCGVAVCLDLIGQSIVVWCLVPTGFAPPLDGFGVASIQSPWLIHGLLTSHFAREAHEIEVALLLAICYD